MAKTVNSKELRCKDKRFSYGDDWFIHWCPNAKSIAGRPDSIHYDDGRSINWLRKCAATGKIVVHNKKCDCGFNPQEGINK